MWIWGDARMFWREVELGNVPWQSHLWSLRPWCFCRQDWLQISLILDSMFLYQLFQNFFQISYFYANSKKCEHLKLATGFSWIVAKKILFFFFCTIYLLAPLPDWRVSHPKGTESMLVWRLEKKITKEKEDWEHGRKRRKKKYHLFLNLYVDIPEACLPFKNKT